MFRPLRGHFQKQFKNRVWISGSWVLKGVEVGDERSTFVVPTIFSKNSNSVFENGIDQGYKIISLAIRNEQLLSLFMRPYALWQVESRLTKKAVIRM